MYPPHHLAGAEMMLHSILRVLANRGHDCRVVAIPLHGPEGHAPYVRDGVKVCEDERALEGCDVLLTHLDRTRRAEELAFAMDVPLVHILHNHLTLSRNRVKKADLVVYNTRWLAEAVSFPAPYVVVHPPVWAEDYRTAPGECITLVNLQEMKGVRIFHELARMMPDRKFLGVVGAYGVQEQKTLPNVEYLQPQSDMREVYKRTRILLMPSSYESYGRCAVEAAVSGIPTVANGTAGLMEALGKAGTFPNELTAKCWKAAIKGIDWDKKSRQSKRLAASLDPVAEIEVLENALYAIKETTCRT